MKKGAGGQYTLEEHLSLTGDMLFDWDGETPYAIVDDDDVVFAVLGGMPRDEGKGKSDRPTYNEWKKVASTASSTRERVRSSYQFTKEQLHHRRGDFVAIDHGISFGGGQKVGSI
jgi:hypothetical protein